MKYLAILVFMFAANGCVAVRVVDAAASTAVGVTKTTVKAGGAAIDATVDTFDADEDETPEEKTPDRFGEKEDADQRP